MFQRAGFADNGQGQTRNPKAQLVLGETTWEGTIIDGIITWRE